MIESNHVVLWNRCLEVIKDNVPETTYNTWFAPIVPLKYEDKTLILQIPSQFFYEILEERFVDLIRKTLYKVIGEGTKLMYNVMVDKTSIPNQTVNLEASNRSTAVTPKSIVGGNKAPSFLKAPAVQDLRKIQQVLPSIHCSFTERPEWGKHTWQTQSVLKSKNYMPIKEYCMFRHICFKCNIQTPYVITRPTTLSTSTRQLMY